VENTANSDIESQLSMSINKDIAFSEQQMSHVQYDSEGIFKIPAYVKNIYIYLIVIEIFNIFLLT